MAQNQELHEKLARLKAIAADGGKPAEVAPRPAARPPMVSPGFRNPRAAPPAPAEPPAESPAVPALSALLRQEDTPVPPAPALPAPAALDDGIPVLTRELPDAPLESEGQSGGPLESAALPVDIDAAFERHFLRPQALRDDGAPAAAAHLPRPAVAPDSAALLAAARLQAELNQALSRILQEAVARFTDEAAVITARILRETAADSTGRPDAPPADRV